MTGKFNRAVYLLHSSGLTEKKLADFLRSGKADQNFLNGLAVCLDPSPTQIPVYRLTLKYNKSQRPRGKTFDEDALVKAWREMEDSSLSRGEKKRQKHLILERFGVSERTAQIAVREAIEFEELSEWLDRIEARENK